MGLSDDENFVFHCLRHTRATRLVEMGVNLRVIQQFMGHKAIQTTLRYAHVSMTCWPGQGRRLTPGTQST
jgi:site-specific recombinase XerD